MSEENISQTSKYNEAFLQLERLDGYWRLAEQYALSGLFMKWNFILDSIWRELYPDALRLSNADNDLYQKNNAFKKLIKKYIKNNTALYTLLNRRHEFLKYVQDQAGKGGKYSTEDESEY